MAKAPRQKFYDELLSFLADHMFQIPIRSFMEENSLLFDPGIEVNNEHRTIHQRYKRLVDTLLECFCKDSQVTMEEAVAGIGKLQGIPDLRQAFEEIFTQLMAANDFEVFYQMMMKCNITIQEQVLMMILAAVGSLPESMLPGAVIVQRQQQGQGQRFAANAATANHDEDILQRVLRESTVQAEIQRDLEEENLRKVVAVSKNEAENLRKTKEEISEQMKKLTLGRDVDDDFERSSSKTAGPSSKKHDEVRTGETAGSSSKKRDEVSDWPSISQPGQRTSLTSQAGAQPGSGSDSSEMWWPKEVQRDRTKPTANYDLGTSAAVQERFKAEMSKMSPGELAERQNFLRAQRDKLVALKKEQREKQLSLAAESQPSRPQSARAARSALRQTSDGGLSDEKKKEDEKKLAMRRAIADKLKQEVIGSGKH